MRKYLCVLLLCFLAVDRGVRAEVSEGGIKSAVSFIQERGNSVLEILETKTGDEKRKALKELFEAHVHHKSISQFVLGGVRRGLRAVLAEASELEKADIKKRIETALEEFYKTYKKSIIRIYLTSFETAYKGGVFKSVHGKANGNDGGVIVYSTLDRKNGAPPLSLHWVLASVDGNWKVVDLRVEGISQAQKEKEEAAAIINRYQGQCKGDSGKFCTLVALESLTKEHQKINKAWKEKNTSPTNAPAAS